MYLCVYIYVYDNIYIYYMHLSAYIYIYIHLSMYTYIYVYTYTYIHVHVYIYIHTYISISLSLCIYIHICIYIYICTYARELMSTWQKHGCEQLTHAIPAFMPRTILWARTSSFERTDAANPKHESFASASACSSVEKVLTTKTGPNTSSFHIVMCGSTFVITVGAR